MNIQKSTRKNKKYMIKVNNKWVHFGDSRYEQFKDSTPLKLYSHLDHNDPKRRDNYYKRHSNEKQKAEALKKTSKNTPKYFSHKYLW